MDSVECILNLCVHADLPFENSPYVRRWEHGFCAGTNSRPSFSNFSSFKRASSLAAGKYGHDPRTVRRERQRILSNFRAWSRCSLTRAGLRNQRYSADYLETKDTRADTRTHAYTRAGVSLASRRR